MNLRASGTEPGAVAVDPSAERNLRVNTISVVLLNLLTGVLGLGFWTVAARLYPAREVGVAAALIASAAILSTLSLLSIGRIFERFLPLAGTRTGPLFKQGLLIVAMVAVLSGVALIAFGPRHGLFETRWGKAFYPALVVVLALFMLVDGAAAGLGKAWWSGAKNVFHAAAKLGVLILLAGTGSAAAIVASWGSTAAATLFCVLIAMRRRYRTDARFLSPPNLPPRRELWSYFGSSFGLTAVWAIAPLAVPLIVVSRVGAEANAYFAVTWAIVSALSNAVHLAVSPYVAEVAANPDRAAALSRRFMEMMTAVTLVSSVGLVVVGPILLGFVGTEYRVHGRGLLYLGAVFIPLSAVGAVYEGFARVQRRLRLMIAVLSVSSFLIVCGSLVGTHLVGIVGVGWAYLLAESVSAAVLFAPAVFWVRHTVGVSRS
jgi:O-antigen/teichoic acid export membrane protein